MVRLSLPHLMDAPGGAHAAEDHGNSGGIHRPAQRFREALSDFVSHEPRPEPLSFRTVGHYPRHQPAQSRIGDEALLQRRRSRRHVGKVGASGTPDGRDQTILFKKRIRRTENRFQPQEWISAARSLFERARLDSERSKRLPALREDFECVEIESGTFE